MKADVKLSCPSAIDLNGNNKLYCKVATHKSGPDPGPDLDEAKVLVLVKPRRFTSNNCKSKNPKISSQEVFVLIEKSYIPSQGFSLS